MERRFEIGLPVRIVHSHWEDFKRGHEDYGLVPRAYGGSVTPARSVR